MLNLAVAFEERALGPILAATIGYPCDNKWDSEQPEYVGKLLTWDAARPILDYEHYNDFGTINCHAVYVWTETQVLFVGEYDGATGIREVPRNPIACVPEFSGR